MKMYIPQTQIIQCTFCSQKNRITEKKTLVTYQCAKCAQNFETPFKYVVFDCETTGLPSSKSNPHLVQLAWSIVDTTGKVFIERNYIVKPEGFRIPDLSTKVHGITDTHARKVGAPITHVIESFLTDADVDGVRLIGHNINFDLRVLKSELQTIGRKSNIDKRSQFCTMINTVHLCKIPRRGGGYKWASLQELHLHLFGKFFSNGHNAMEDVRATTRCFIELLKRKLIK